MWCVFEHRYYISGQTAPELEYCVAEAKVAAVLKHKNFSEIKYIYTSPEGCRKLGYSKVDRVGARGGCCFRTAFGAATEAKRLSDMYDAGAMRYSYAPIRRTWCQYLIKQIPAHKSSDAVR